MTDTAFVTVQYYDALGIRTRGSYPQELRIRMSEISALVAELIKVVPRDASGAAFDQIIAAARARRPRDRTNAERQRRFRERRHAQQPGAHSSVKKTTPA